VHDLRREPTMTDVAERIAVVRHRLEAAASAAGRRPADVLLVAVSKTHPPEAAAAAVAAGIVDLGENRGQELTAKQPLVEGARWHLIGALQRNKVRDVVGRQVLVHSLDRRSLADALSGRAERQGCVQRVLVQVNVGNDPAKGGCHLDELDELVAYARGLPNLAVEGLMTIPPMPTAGADPADSARPHFAALREARDRLRSRCPEVVHLSMGMSADLEAAVAEGATMVRLGTAIFGPRGDTPWRKDDV
jgi:pyridoxal phosphate enzyme (YggS family)